MIGKVSARGSRVSGLLYYLFGPGRNEAHTDPHLIAGWRHPAELEPPLREDGRRDFRHLSGRLPPHRHHQRRRPGLVQRRETRPRPDLAQTAPPLDTCRRHHAHQRLHSR
jgi:hypothetical protein